MITNKAIWALTVPLPGVDKVVGNTDIGKWQWMTCWQDIVSGLQEMTVSLSLEDVLKQGRAKCLLKREELKAVKTLPFTYALSFVSTSGQKFGYSIRTKQDYIRAKKFFHVP